VVQIRYTKIFLMLLSLVLAAAGVSAYDAECFWTGHNCDYSTGDNMHQWEDNVLEQDPRIHYNWQYYNSYNGGDWDYTNDYTAWQNLYGRPIDTGGWGRASDYPRYVTHMGDDAGYFYMISHQNMDPSYKRGCWNEYCEWYDIHDPEDFIRWTDLQNAITDEPEGNRGQPNMCYYATMGYYYC
jgi:hypothetical protein